MLASEYYGQALSLEPANPQLIGEGFLAALLAGSPQAETLATEVPANALADMLRGNQAAQNGDYAAAGRIYAQLPQDEVIGLIRPLLLAWAAFGAGNVQAALAGLGAVLQQRRVQPRLRPEWRADGRCRA